MTPEQQAAFVNAQTALLNCEVAGMVAENQVRQSLGQSMAYDETAFVAKYKEYVNVLGHNAVVSFFNPY